MPAFCDLEVLAGLRNMLLAAELGEFRASQALADYVAIELIRHDHRSLLHRIFELRANFSPYDASYIALAERLDATFVTCDLRLTRAARQFSDLNVVGVGA